MTEKHVIKGLLSFHRDGEYQNALYVSSLKEPLVDALGFIKNKKVTVRYYISDVQLTEEEANKEWIKKISGCASCKYNHRYSEITGYLWTDENLKIGGHDLLKELSSYVGKWLILELIIHS